MNYSHILNEFQKFITTEKLDFFLVSSTDEYLNEYVNIEINSRYFITGFTGSTGDVLISADKSYLFVDGRYHEQADNEVDHDKINVVKLNMRQTQKEAINNIVKKSNDQRLKIGIVSSKISYSSFVSLSKELDNVEFVEYSEDPICKMSKIALNEAPWKLRTVPEEVSGISANKKLDLIKNKLSDIDIFVVTKLEEITYLTNLRGNEIPFSSSFKAKAIIYNNKCTIFTDINKFNTLKTNDLEMFEFLPESDFNNYLEKFKNKNLKIGIDQNSINLLTYRELEKTQNAIVNLETNPLEEMKAVKNIQEQRHIQECFLKTDIVMSRTKTWLNQELRNNKNVSEKDISERVKQFFIEEGAFSLSFEVISSVGKNTSIIHYSNPDPEKYVCKGDLILIDCGGYFEGGYATDITRSFIAGTDVFATKEQKHIFTTVLRAFLNGLNYPITNETTGFDIDKAVRDVINENLNEGFAFPHGTGHGVGISVHESPPRISPAESAKSPLKQGMCFTIEPGLYNDSWGGVRLENTVVVINNNNKLELKSLAKSNFDERLVDYSLMSEQEKVWFNEYQKKAID